jgi:hypothetical protein
MSRTIPTRFGRVSPLTPEWRRGVTETYEFKTEVIEARDGLEQRSALRENPRYSLEHNTHLYRGEIDRYLGDLAEAQHQPFHVPVVWRRVFLAAPAAALDATISVSEVPWWLTSGSRLVISAGGQVEAVEVQSIAGTTLTLAEALTGDYAAGGLVTLALYARAQDDVDFRAETGAIWRGRVVWEQDPGADPWPALPAAPTTYDGHEVFLHRPNWREQPRISIKQYREMVDSGRGTVAISAPTTESQLEFRLLYAGFDADTSDELIAFFLRMKGKRGSFWMPTWQRDVTPLASSGSVLDIAGDDAFYAYNGSRVFRALAVCHPDGSYQVNKITGVSQINAAADTRFTMAEAWASPVTPDSVVSWCPLWRFATDRLEVERVTGTVSEMQFSVLSLVQETS